MRQAGILAVLLILSLLAAGWQGSNVPLHQPTHPTSDSSITILQSWINDIIAQGEKDSAHAFAALQSAIQQAQNRKNKYHEALLERAYGKLLRHHREYHRSFGRYHRCHELVVALNDTIEMVTSSLDLAKAQYYRGNYRHAMQHYSYGVYQARLNNLKEKELEALEILGLLYNAFQNFNRGAAVFREALELKYQLNDAPGILYTLEILSAIYYRQHKYDSSLLYSQQAYELAVQQQKQSDRELSQLNKAAVCIRLHRYREAREELNALSRGDVRGTNVNLAVRYHVLEGNYYLALRQDEQAHGYYNRALAYAGQNYFQELFALVYSHMADSYFERGEYKLAYEYARKYQDMAAEYYTGENVIRLGNLETVLRSELSEDEIRHLNNENKLKALQLLRASELRANLEKENMLKDSLLRKEQQLREVLSREHDYKKKELESEKRLREVLSNDNIRQQSLLRSERRMRLLLLMAVIAMLALGAVVFYLYRKQRRKNDIIQRQADDMAILMKEIHHRVKNNLQIISSLLDLQALSIRHDQAALAVKEGRNRVQSMALIHQNLYKEGNIKGIKVQSYIETLAQGLFHSYNIRPGSVQLTTDIDDLNLDVDTVIPIGLILNELITNSLKYAFPGKTPGCIDIILRREGERLLLKVKDNGVGFATQTMEQPDTFGIKLVRAFAQKLKATLAVYNDNGACVEMVISRFKMA